MGLRAKIAATCRGDKTNATEGRAVLHTALRARRTEATEVEGQNMLPLVHGVLEPVPEFSGRVRGRRIRDLWRWASERATWGPIL